MWDWFRDKFDFGWLIFWICIVYIVLSLTADASPSPVALKEKDYQIPFCIQNGGVYEHVLPDRTRVDCLTGTHAIEVDFASKWAESIGQALYYSAMTEKRAGVLLIMREGSDKRYIDRFTKTIDAYRLPIDLWITGVFE